MRITVGYKGKRLMDLVLAGTALVLLSPVLCAVAAFVRVFLGSPVLYRQLRPGLDGQPFTLLKFRTMNERRDADGRLLPDEMRQTRFGNFLRRSSLDELPELWNVMRGEMSLVGPRPLMMAYLPRYTARQMQRHAVLPGITGLAQVNGRNAVDWEQRFQWDLYYVENCSPGLDLEILWKTVRAVVSREGVSAPGHFSIPEFMGSEKTEEKCR